METWAVHLVTDAPDTVTSSSPLAIAVLITAKLIDWCDCWSA